MVYAPAVARIIASFLGTGLILRQLRTSDGGSGTVASVVAAALAYFLSPVWGRALACVVLIVLGTWAVATLRLEDDPGWVVIDEAAGMLLASIGLGLVGLLVSLVVFRLADINKRVFPGVAPAERLRGATGIMADDLVAGLYGLAAGWAVEAIRAA